MSTALVKVVLLLALSTVLMTGCRSGSDARAHTPALADGEETDWFCQEDGDSGEWDCIQDDALAHNPESATRVPTDGSD